MIKRFFSVISLIFLSSVLGACIPSEKKPKILLKGEEYYGRHHKESNKDKANHFDNEGDEDIDINILNSYDSEAKSLENLQHMNLDEEEEDQQLFQVQNSGITETFGEAGSGSFGSSQNKQSIKSNDNTNFNASNDVGSKVKKSSVKVRNSKSDGAQIPENSSSIKKHSKSSHDNLPTSSDSGLDQEIVDLIKSIE